MTTTTWTEYVEDDGCDCCWCGEPLERGTVVAWRNHERGHEDCEAIATADEAAPVPRTSPASR